MDAGLVNKQGSTNPPLSRRGDIILHCFFAPWISCSLIGHLKMDCHKYIQIHTNTTRFYEITIILDSTSRAQLRPWQWPSPLVGHKSIAPFGPPKWSSSDHPCSSWRPWSNQSGWRFQSLSTMCVNLWNQGRKIRNASNHQSVLIYVHVFGTMWCKSNYAEAHICWIIWINIDHVESSYITGFTGLYVDQTSIYTSGTAGINTFNILESEECCQKHVNQNIYIRVGKG